MIDPIAVIGDTEMNLRKVNNALRSEISLRLLIDVESILGSIRMLELDAMQRDNDTARTPSDYRHD